jgi:hypothetical protein
MWAMTGQAQAVSMIPTAVWVVGIPFTCALTIRGGVCECQTFRPTMSIEPAVEPVRVQRVFVTQDGTRLGWVATPT